MNNLFCMCFLNAQQVYSRMMSDRLMKTIVTQLRKLVKCLLAKQHPIEQIFIFNQKYQLCFNVFSDLSSKVICLRKTSPHDMIGFMRTKPSGFI